MSTTQNPSAAVTAQITEADLLAYLDAMTKKYAPEFPDVTEFHATVFGFGMRKVGFYGHRDARYTTISAYGPTFAEAAVTMREELGTPETKAAKLREQAAKMLAEAEQLQNGRAA